MKEYIRKDALAYAKKWAYSRNPAYYAFDKVGGDCTSFVSQCIYAGSKVMNFTPTFGWYYINSTQRSPSWTGVQYLYDFLVNNTGPGPFATEVPKSEVQIADIIQLGNSERFYHSLFVNAITKDNIFVASHDFDAYMRNLNTYSFEKIRFLHIIGVNPS